MNDYLNVSEIAELTGKHEETVRRWIREGRFSKVKKGAKNMTLIAKDELAQILEGSSDITSPLINLISSTRLANSYIWPLSSGDELTREELQNVTTCPVYSGILYRANTPEISIITSTSDVSSNEKNPYADRFEEGYLFYTGEGQKGPQTLTRGNLRLYKAEISKQPIHVFLKEKVNQYVFIGLFEVINHQTESQPDADKNIRDAFIFKLRPILLGGARDPQSDPLLTERKTNEQLVQELLSLQETLKNGKISKQNLVTRYKRSKKLVDNLKEVYNYECQLCNPSNPLPTIPMKNNRNYLEVHHIEGFAEVLGENSQTEGNFVVDDVNNTICCCVYHHKLLHHYKSKILYSTEKQAFISEDQSLVLRVYTKHDWHRIGEKV